MSDIPSFVYHDYTAIRASAIIMVSEVTQEALAPEESVGDQQYGNFTVTLTNGYPITIRHPVSTIYERHADFMNQIRECEAQNET